MIMDQRQLILCKVKHALQLRVTSPSYNMYHVYLPIKTHYNTSEMHDGFVLDALINTHLPTIGTIRIYSV